MTVLAGHSLAVTDLTTTAHSFGAGAASSPAKPAAKVSAAPAASSSASLAHYPTLLSGGRDGTVRAWDVSTGRETARARHGAPVWSLTAYGDRVFSGGADGRVVVWSAFNGTSLVELRVPRQAVCVCPFGTTVLVGTSQGFLVCFDSGSGERIWTSRLFRDRCAVRRVVVDPAGCRLIVVSQFGALRTISLGQQH